MFFKHTKWAMLWALLIFILCAIPGKDLPDISYFELLELDKWVHASMFFVLQVLLIWGFTLQSSFYILRHFPKLTSASLSILYGISLELMQYAFFSGRTADIFDVIANTTGSILGIVFYEKVRGKLLIKYLN